MPTVDFFQLTDIGCVREENEDAIGYWPHEDGLLFAVADGLGGYNAGQVASALAIETLGREMDRAPGSWPVEKRLRRAIQEANIAIHQKSITIPELQRMATTITASAIVGSELVAAHVGDCRLYRLREEQFTQLTKYHTWVWEQVEYGILSPEEARTHPRRHMLTRSLGQHLIVGIDVLRTDVQNGDRLVQCSDGIHGLLPEGEIAAMLQTHPPEGACRAVVQLARERGGDDNMSIQVAAVIDCPPPVARPWWRFGR